MKFPFRAKSLSPQTRTRAEGVLLALRGAWCIIRFKDREANRGSRWKLGVESLRHQEAMFPDPGAEKLVQAAIDSVHEHLCKANGQHTLRTVKATFDVGLTFNSQGDGIQGSVEAANLVRMVTSSPLSLRSSS